jgi:hypothetical protein
MSDTAAGNRRVRLHYRPPFGTEGKTLREIAAALGVDEETAMFRLIDAGCDGWLETDLHRWRPVARHDRGGRYEDR